MQSGFFVFEKIHDPLSADSYKFPVNLSTRTELREFLNAQLKTGSEAEDFLIIRGREEKITAIKVVAEFETAES